MNQEIIFLLFIIIIIIIYNLILNKNKHIKYILFKNNQLNKKLNSLNNKDNEKEKNKENQIPINQINQNIALTRPNDIVNLRDVNTTDNPSYPINGRVERPIIDSLMYNPLLFNYPTRGSPDTYRPMAYAKDKKTDEIFYLMGRQKYQGSSQGEFYLISTSTINRLKISLLDQSGNSMIRDYYNLPNELIIKNGVFHGKHFEIQELKQADLSSPYF
jgi:hypothetical protein